MTLRHHLSWPEYADQMRQARLEQALALLLESWKVALCGRSPGGHPLVLDAAGPEVYCRACDFYPPVQMTHDLIAEPIRVVLEVREPGSVRAIPVPPPQEPCIWHD